jgi:hypothetical protein
MCSEQGHQMKHITSFLCAVGLIAAAMAAAMPMDSGTDDKYVGVYALAKQNPGDEQFVPADYREAVDRMWKRMEADDHVSLVMLSACIHCSLRCGVYAPNEITDRLEVWIAREPKNAYPLILAAVTRMHCFDYDGAVQYYLGILPDMYLDDYLGDFVCDGLRGEHLLPDPTQWNPWNRPTADIDTYLDDVFDYIIAGTRGAIINGGSIHAERDSLSIYAEALYMHMLLKHELPTMVAGAYGYVETEYRAAMLNVDGFWPTTSGLLHKGLDSSHLVEWEDPYRAEDIYQTVNKLILDDYNDDAAAYLDKLMNDSNADLEAVSRATRVQWIPY